MAQVKVYRYWGYDISSDSKRISTRMGTRVAIEALGKRSNIIEDSGIEIDESQLEPYSDGFTTRHFTP